MARLFDGFVALEMVVLGILELSLCFLVFYILLLPGDTSPAASGFLGLHPLTASHAAILSLTVGLISMAIGMYRPEICLQTRRLLLNSVIAGLLAFPAILALSLVTDLDPSFIFGQDALWPMKILLSWILLLFITRLCFRVVLRSGLVSRPVLIVGSPAQAQATTAALRAMRRGFFSLAGIVAPADAGQLTAERLRGRRIWAVVVTEDARAAMADAPARLGAHVRLFDDVAFRERQLRRLDLDHLAPGWLDAAAGERGPSRHAAPPDIQAVVRRAADIAISLSILAITLPVMVLAAVLVRLTSPGPILYRQVRVGLRGHQFVLFKFRSMRTDAEAAGPAWAARHDPRVTPIGRIMRCSRIDELPQLLNVLRGEMSIVGPRPDRPFFVAQLNTLIPFHADRTLVKPGITGWAQVNYPYGASVEDARQKLAYDLYYVKHRNLLLDLLILIATVRVILFQEGAR
ncbi:MAG: exopolysaccharide biosynthesis polyprenyl glycosylphosphotransferase [Acetobacteraceae bacterium]|nr:exopolysaccharide biosynthesis polyprenyl glycosylphosphotransferase [Acetobacteraceae bacterium]